MTYLTRNLIRRRTFLHLAGSAMLASGSGSTFAQAFPSRAVKVIVPFPAGGATDLLARILSRTLSETLGQPFIVDNRAGANGNLGTSAVVSAPADGYTLLFAPTGPLVYNPFLYKGLTFDPVSELTPIVKAAEIPLVIAAHPAVPAHNLKDLVTIAQSKPGALTYSSAGNGSMGHLTAEILQKALGIELTHVPYKGSAPALTDLLAGVVNLSFDLAPTYAQYVRNGRVNALAITTKNRSALLPEVATVAEQAITGFDITNWSGFVAPKGTPSAVITRINEVVNQFITSASGRKEIEALGMQVSGGTPEDMRKFIASEVETWGPVAKSVAL